MSSTPTIDDLSKLAELRQSGAITEDEFVQMKARVLDTAQRSTSASETAPLPSTTSSGVGFSEAVSRGFSRYATFAGRAPRSEYWFWTLFSVLASIAAIVVDAIMHTNPFFYMLCLLALLLPHVSVAVRRLHDRGRSGGWYWLILVPIVGAIVLFVWFCTKGDDGENEYGSDPLASA